MRIHLWQRNSTAETWRRSCHGSQGWTLWLPFSWEDSLYPFFSSSTGQNNWMVIYLNTPIYLNLRAFSETVLFVDSKTVSHTYLEMLLKRKCCQNKNCIGMPHSKFPFVKTTLFHRWKLIFFPFSVITAWATIISYKQHIKL